MAASTPTTAPIAAGDPLSALVPPSLTNSRSFTSTDDITALVHVFSGGTDQPSSVTASASILDWTDKEHFTTERILTPDAVTRAIPVRRAVAARTAGEWALPVD